ncbi:MAG TPA: hypothetical protein VK699_19865 [Terriglobales bacterium]|jgi:hypothetical protein|nr:hypothetical protein [Terriglobales bacterium]
MASKTIKAKRKGFELEARTFQGKKSGLNYLVFKTLNGGFHVFVETQAKDAAEDCGAERIHTRRDWNSLWDNSN